MFYDYWRRYRTMLIPLGIVAAVAAAPAVSYLGIYLPFVSSAEGEYVLGNNGWYDAAPGPTGFGKVVMMLGSGMTVTILACFAGAFIIHVRSWRAIQREAAEMRNLRYDNRVMRG